MISSPPEWAYVIQKMYIHPYWSYILRFLEENPQLQNNFPSFMLVPEHVHIYLGQTHVVIEYTGRDKAEPYVFSGEYGMTVHWYQYQNLNGRELLDQITGIKFQPVSTNNIYLPLIGVVEDLFMHTDDAFAILTKNRWNWDAQSFMTMFGSVGLEFVIGESAILRNCFLYDADEYGLKVRRIRWMEAYPVSLVSENDEIATMEIRFPDLQKMALEVVTYEYSKPPTKDHRKLEILNRFIELFNGNNVSETDITRFLAQPANQFILVYRFNSSEIHAEKECLWQSDDTRKGIKPDFFVVLPNGFTDIVEFKLPTLKGNSIVGKENRETFSAELNSYIAQTRVYKEYFEDPRNREYVKICYGLNVKYPRCTIVIGRRTTFDNEEWKAIQNDYRDLDIVTYDDLVDLILSFLYLP